MDYTELDKEEQERRKKDQVEFRTRKRNSRLFLFLGCTFEIIETFIIVLVLFVLSVAILSRVLPQEIAGKVISIFSIIAFFGGLFIGFLIYRTTVRFVIKKFHLEDKLTEEVIKQYSKVSKEEIEASKKR